MCWFYFTDITRKDGCIQSPTHKHFDKLFTSVFWSVVQKVDVHNRFKFR